MTRVERLMVVLFETRYIEGVSSGYGSSPIQLGFVLSTLHFMHALRWTLGSVTTFVVIGFIALVVFGNGFRRSWGASDNSALNVGLTVAVMLALVASIFLPPHQLVLHSVAVVVVALLGSSLWMFRESAFVGTFGVIYCALWFAYYHQALAVVR